MLPCCVPDPHVDSSLKKLCEARLSVSGTFDEKPKPRDKDFVNAGCWPVGIWRFSATVEEMGCEEPPALLPEYAFEVTRDERDLETYRYLTGPEDARALVKVSSGGGGLCEGSVELHSVDGTHFWNFKPALEDDKTLRGFGEYEVYNRDHR